MKFVHLHTHSHYSLLDGLSKLDDLVARAQEFEMPALAITDHGALYGAIEFYKLAKGKGIKPIIGIETYVAARTRFDKESGLDSKRYHLTLLAKNIVGYRNLIKLSSLAALEGYYYKPRVDKEILRKYSEGIICLSGCFASELSHAVRAHDMDKAIAVAEEYRDIFGKENYFLEVMAHQNVEGLMEARAKIIEIGRKLNIPLVATQDSHYVRPEDARAQETLLAIQTNTDLTDENRLSMKTDDFSFIDTATALERFKDIPEAVANTERIAEMCTIELELGKWVFPDIKISEGSTYDDELRKLTYNGLMPRALDPTKEVTDRIEYELDIIKKKGYAPYFLVVADLMRFAREKGILTTVRGSVAGSITTYLSGITNVNPLAFKLPFERFLNPERPSAPDMDMDFADNRRDEVIQYAREKYGEDRVAQIGTFGTMMAKGAVRDVARALGHPYAKGDRISALIPLGAQGFPMTIDRAMELVPDLTSLYKTDAETKEIIDLARRLEGCVRHVSVHAAGVVIGPKELTEFVPLQLDPRGGKVITQYDMHAVEDAGLLKFDFLGIRNLAILGDAVRLTKERHGIDIDIENVPLDDAKTFSLLAHGNTIGLFQLNGSGMTRYLKELKPSRIEDINAMVALYRPGPMESIPKYIERKHNPSLVQYLDPRLKDILTSSFGVIAYQDDVLLIAIHLAGYSWLEADKLRKAMGKKIPEVMKAEEEKLKKGFVAKGMTPAKADELWKLIEPFAAYGFNKAHAASYGKVAYQTAYMKANYPVEYMNAVLTAESGDIETISEIITECKRMGIAVLPPDVNQSFAQFTIVDDTTIRFGLLTVKNMGDNIVNAIIAARTEHGTFTSLEDFLTNVQHKDLNKKSLESLVKCGALDGFGERAQLLHNTEKLIAFSKDSGASRNTNQITLFDMGPDIIAPLKLHLEEAPPISRNQKLSWEKELLGLYVSDHPLSGIAEHMKAGFTKISEVPNKKIVDGMIKIGGLISQVKKVVTKTGSSMAFVSIEDLSGSVEALVFPKLFERNPEFWASEKIITMKGRVSHRDNEVKFICESAEDLVLG